jgi:hypothetical protein
LPLGEFGPLATLSRHLWMEHHTFKRLVTTRKNTFKSLKQGV